ncbi:MAG TPA: HAD family phosphatase [Intrasporangium sp.]|uniref:HAD family hydrolase n=1 Tax=Intrasporangium sp. TaxID=1925024 RepID=UPI002B480631|nr:HAD family phosphatase [Intrasporangium sp.]HKX66484.1 HAD family phosphatase [Intrasporangium sp.]
MSDGVQAVVFDLDGVLVDSEGIWDEVRRGLAAEHDRAWPDDATDRMMGMSTQEWSTYLVDTVGVPGPAPDVAQTVIARMADRYREHLPLLPGAVEAVRRLAQRWPLGLASSSPRRLIDAVLAAANLTDNFRVTMSTEQVEEGKPSPLVYLAVARHLDVAPETVVAIEDSSNGLRSASGAGMHLIAVPRPAFPPAPDALSLADAVLEHLDDVTVDLVASLALGA